MLYNQASTPAEIMICAMSRLVKDGMTVFHGVSSHMPMLALMLARQTHAKNAVHLNIPGGVDPEQIRVSDYTSAGGELTRDNRALFPLAEVFDLSMRGGLDLAFFSGVQFDVNGNMNASVIGDYDHPKVRLPGGAGCAVLIPTVKSAVLWRTKHDARTFVEQVDFVTTRGNIDYIVSPLCVFKMRNGKLTLYSVHPHTTFAEVQANTGFELSQNGVTQTPPPTAEEMRVLNEIDPQRIRDIEF